MLRSGYSERARLDNLAALGGAPSKSLDAGILEPENLVKAREHLFLQPSTALMNQLDAALRNVVYVSDRSDHLKGGFVRALRDAARCAKAIALMLGEQTQHTSDKTTQVEVWRLPTGS